MPVPASRLTADDLYDRIDRAEETFAEGDDFVEIVRGDRLRLVSTVDLRIAQLVGVLIHIRDPHYTEAMTLVDELKRSRISTSVDMTTTFERLREVVAAWDAARQLRRAQRSQASAA